MGERWLGPYRLERRLGKGGMGEVWQAAHPPTGGRVALKILREGEQASVGRFLEEARLGATFSHPGLVRVLDSGVERDRPWLAMELLEGRTLAELRRARPEGWPVGLVGALGLQALAALAVLHEAKGEDGAARPIVHRDLKPSNLLLTREGALKVIDLGVALATSTERTRTRSGVLVGSVRYASPEQARGEAVTPRTDLFSLALVLQELLTGQRVFDQPDEVAVLSALLWQPVPRASAARAELPAAVDEVLAWALQKDPARRPASAHAFAEALERAVGPGVWPRTDLAGFVVKAEASLPAADEDGASGTESLLPRSGPWREVPPRGAGRRRRWERLGLAALVAVVLAGVAVGLELRGTSAPSPLASHVPTALREEPIEVTAPPLQPARTEPTEAQPEPTAPPTPEPPTSAALPKAPVASPAAAVASKKAPSRSHRRRAKALEPGFLTVNVQPGWGDVLLDGRAVGQTPLYRFSVPAGAHEVEAVRKDGVRRRRRLSITPRHEAKVVFRW